MSAPVAAAADGAAAVAYRDLMSAFPTGVAVVTAIDGAGQPHGLTCTSLTSVAVHPPTLLVSLDLRCGTLWALRERGAFAVNLLPARARATAELFAAAVPDRFGRVCWRPSGTVGAPWLVEDAFAMAECRVAGVLPAGDHLVVLGEVVSAQRDEEVPLLYGLRRFAAWPSPDGNAAPHAAPA